MKEKDEFSKCVLLGDKKIKTGHKIWKIKGCGKVAGQMPQWVKVSTLNPNNLSLTPHGHM